MPTHDVLIIGAGLAGQRAALAAADAGATVAILSKVHPVRSHSTAAAGGINAALNPEDSLGVARVRHGQGLGLPGRPGRDRDHVPRGARRDPHARALRRHLPPQRDRAPGHPRVRRRLAGAHLLRGRHHRPGAAARALRAADALPRPRRPLRGVVRHLAAAGRRRRLRGRHRPQRPRRAHGAVRRQGDDPGLGRRRPGVQAHHQRPDLHRRRAGPVLPHRRAADGHGDGPVPPHHAGRERLPDHRGRPRRGRAAVQQGRRALHGEVRAQQDGAGLARRGLPRRADRDQRGPRRRRTAASSWTSRWCPRSASSRRCARS